MPNAHPSLSGRPLARTLSCVLLSLCGAAAAAADSRPAFPTGFLATPHARTSPLAARETITLRNQSVLWQEGTFRTGLDVSLVGTNSLTLRGDLSTETEVRDAFAEILRISGEDNSSLAVSLETASAPTTGGSAPTQLLFDRRAFDDFRGKMFVRAGTYTAVVVADKEFFPDFSQWDPMDGRDFARPTLWVYGSFDVKENVFFTLGNASSDANVAVGGDARLILSGTPSDHGAHLYGSGTVSFDPGALVLVTDETFAQTERDWHVLFGKDLEISGLDNLTVCLPDGSLSGNFVVSGNDVIFTTYKARHTGPLGGFASKLVDAMDDRWMPAALRDFLEDELFATAAYGSDLGPAVEYLATAHLRTGLEEDMVNDASSLAPRLWRTGRAAKPVLPLWVSETDRKAYEKAWEKATPEERKKLRNPADPLGLSLWVEVTDGTTESETYAHKRPADRRETDRTGFRLAGVWSRGDDAFGAMMRYEDRTTTVGTDDAWRVFGAASLHRMSDYSHEWEASGDTIVREKTDARIFASLGLGARWEGGLFPNVKWLEGWTGFAEVSVWGYAGELRREGRIEAPWAEKELSDSWRGSELARVRGEGSFGVRGAWRNYRFAASGRFAGGADGYESRSWMITVGRQY